MKIIFKILIFIVVGSMTAQKKEFDLSDKVTFGVVAGLNQSYAINGLGNDDTRTSFYAGLATEYQITEKWGVEVDVLYASSYGYNFIEIPILGKYNLTDKLSFVLGPKLDFLVDQSSASERLELFGVSATVGVQFDFSKHFYLEGRYNYGLSTQIINDAPNSFSGQLNTLRIGMGYKF